MPLSPEDKTHVQLMINKVQDEVTALRNKVAPLQTLGQKLSVLLQPEPKNPWNEDLSEDELDKLLANCKSSYVKLFGKALPDLSKTK